MDNFNWNFPTEIVYGEGRVNEIGKIAKSYGKKAMIATYKRGGFLDPIIDNVESLLREAGIEFVTFTGIEPNPRAQTIDKAIEIFKSEQCDFVIALGGGSVIDGSKYIAATGFSGGKSWDYVVLGDRVPREYTGAYPIIAIPTMSASGSECNAGGVLTNAETNEKSFSRSAYRYPKVAIVDPGLLTSVPLSITKDSCVDIFSHLIEHYLSSQAESEFADRATEGMILTLKENFDKIIKDPTDIAVRGQIALCSIFGWSGFQALGRMGSIPMHSIEMPLSAVYDLPHARGMTIIIPPYLKVMAEAMPARWAKLARRCFGVTEEDDLKAAKLLSVKVVEWLKDTESYLTLEDVDIPSDQFERMAEDVVRMFPGSEPSTTTGPRPITKEEIIKIYEMSQNSHLTYS
ncbi:alcohol dehydrogenase (plasmid) [Exiguobacterium sp. N4-1P]|uniref:iron-containing alcohol dehydrogenase n=1 Tax=Exiguobacterium sp. N4-1P TaxID=2051906 RepID=UPI000B58C21C|nr:iron-containing alcohol dehydrogenase [Exiguobacterium sp. N4-1P]ASI35340.1 alcohol dehydrogenase [Exiguobacterium sp. N4-1P]ASI37353.1 alcohol dehydrogenase [Exiguobacterium sp. N4-1P]